MFALQPSEGFPTHPHSDYEIFSYVVNGALKHRDSMHNTETIGKGTVQFTSAGSGISHSEFNASSKDMVCSLLVLPLFDRFSLLLVQVHFLQLWVKPAKSGLKPSYQTRFFPEAGKQGKLSLIIAPDGDPAWKPESADQWAEGKGQGQQTPPPIKINQDVRVYASLLKAGERVTLDVAPGREAYIHLIQDATGMDKEANKTAIKVNGNVLRGGDGAFVLHAKKGVCFFLSSLTLLFIADRCCLLCR